MSKPLEIYYTLDVEETFDKHVLSKCLHVFLSTQLKYNIERFEEINQMNCEIYDDIEIENDIVKCGLMKLSRMFDILKLKTKNDVYFVYIGNGDIKNIYKNISVILINKNPYEKECNYVISKKQFDIQTDTSKETKLNNLQLFTKALREIFSVHKTIKYNGLG